VGAWASRPCEWLCIQWSTVADQRIQKRRGAYLPHWTTAEGIYNVRFRLVDSVPKEKLDDWRFEQNEILSLAKRQKRDLTYQERIDLLRLHTDSVERFLRSGHGSCWLKDDRVAKITADALKFFDGKRYKLFAWCIMPNHLHVVLRSFPSFPLPDIAHSWKSFTSKEANKIIGRKGIFWQSEYFDRLIKNMDQLKYTIEYIWSNPELAGLKDWRWRWKIDEDQLDSISF